MKGKLRLAGILAVLVLLLGGLATWDEWQTKQDKAGEKTKNKLADFKPEEVLELDYFNQMQTAAEGAGDKPDDTPKPDQVVELSAVKKDGVWRLTKPIDALADGAAIESLINTLHDYSYTKVVSSKRETWGEYGLLEPKRRVSLRLGGNTPQTVTVYFGMKAPIGYDTYLRTSLDDKVLLGSQHILVSTSKTLDDFRDRSLVKIDEAKLRAITYQWSGDPAINLTKADGKYSIVLPEKLDADAAAIKEFIDSLNQLKVAGFIDTPDDASKALFSQPKAVITWQEETGEKATLKTAERGGKLLAAFDPAQRIYTLPDDYKAKLHKDLIDFRNRRILEPDALDAKTVQIDGDVFKNIEGNWYTADDAAKFDDKAKFKGPEQDKPQERAHLRAFMVDLEFAKTDRFIPLSDPLAKGLPPAPAHRVILSYFDQTKKPVSIDLYPSPGDTSRYLVMRTGSPYLYRVATSAFNSMVPSQDPVPLGKGVGDGPGQTPTLDPALDDSGGEDGAYEGLGGAPLPGSDQAGSPNSRDAG